MPYWLMLNLDIRVNRMNWWKEENTFVYIKVQWWSIRVGDWMFQESSSSYNHRHIWMILYYINIRKYQISHVNFLHILPEKNDNFHKYNLSKLVEMRKKNWDSIRSKNENSRCWHTRWAEKSFDLIHSFIHSHKSN